MRSFAVAQDDMFVPSPLPSPAGRGDILISFHQRGKVPQADEGLIPKPQKIKILKQVQDDKNRHSEERSDEESLSLP